MPRQEPELMVLYKYFPRNLTKILSQHLLRFTQPAEFNDPFESRPHLDSVARGPNLHQTIMARVVEWPDSEWDAIEPEIRRGMTKEQFVGLVQRNPAWLFDQLGRHGKDWARNYAQVLWNDTNSELGVLCLTESNDNLLMWGHYSSKHEGFVVGFDATHKWFHLTTPDDPFNQPKKVTYTIDRACVPMLDVTVTEHLLTKSKDWEYEQEWRMIRHLDEADVIKPVEPYPRHLFRFPPESVVSVFMGCRMPADLKREVQAVLSAEERYASVSLYSARISETRFELQFSEHKL